MILPQLTVSCYLPKMLEFTKWVNSDLAKGFTVSQVAQKHGWPEYLVWSQVLVNTDDFNRFKALQWGILKWLSGMRLFPRIKCSAGCVFYIISFNLGGGILMLVLAHIVENELICRRVRYSYGSPPAGS